MAAEGGNESGERLKGAAEEGGGGAGVVRVAGQVVTFDEYPIAGAVIEIAGEELVTDAQGRFQTETELPYDIVIHHPENLGEWQVAELPLNSSDAYLDVTRQDVKLYSRVKLDRWCGLSGAITGTASPSAGARRTAVSAIGAPLHPSRSGYNTFLVDQAAGAGPSAMPNMSAITF